MLLMIAISLLTLQSQVRCVTLIEEPEIDQYCGDEVCTDLYFYDENDVLLHAVHGTDARINGGRGVKRVAKVKTVGHYGSTLLYPRLSPPLLIGG